MAADGHPVCADVRGRTTIDGEEPGTAPQTAERQGGRKRTEVRRGAKWGDVCHRIRGGRTQLALPVAGTSRMGRVGRRRAIPFRLYLVCRGAAREHLPLTHHRSAGGPKGHRHGTLRHCPPPDVHRHHHSLPLHAVGAGLAHLLPDHVALYPPHRQAHPQRGSRFGRRTQRLPRVQTTGEIQSFAVYLVKLWIFPL